MPNRTLRLNYPAALLRQPIVQQLIRTFNVSVNIVRAQISLEEGWLEIEVEGAEAELDRAEAWLGLQGIEVLQIE
jgi:ABC-type methionine transport system ATPase subunit